MIAELVRALDEQGIAAIALDLLFAEASDDDPILAEALASAGTVVVAAAALDAGVGADGGPLRVSTLVRPVEMIADTAAAAAPSFAAPDASDGVLRHYPLVTEQADRRVLPSIALAAYSAATGQRDPPVLRPGGGLQIAGHFIPTDEHYRLRISWPHGLAGAVVDAEGSPTVVSAVDVLDGQIHTTEFDGRVAFVGVTDPSLGDRHITPVAQVGGTPGVAYHAAAFHTMASREFLLPATLLEVLLWIVVAASVAAFATQFLPLWVAAVTNAAAVVGVAIAALARSDTGVLVDIVDPVLAVALAIPLSGGVRYLVEERLRRRVSHLFSQYVPRAVASELIRGGRIQAAAEGQRSEVTVLFCDLRGFTPMAAASSPAEVNRILSAYYEYASRRILGSNGTLIQYVGDEVFAVYGAPTQKDDDARRAVETALALQADRDELLASLNSIGAKPIAYGISVHTGEVIATHAGSSVRRQYSVIGDPVNVGSRLCGQAGPGEVVISSDTLEQSGLSLEGEWFEPELKGVSKPVRALRFRVTDNGISRVTR